MRRWLYLARVGLAAVSATLMTPLRRLRHGPTLPSWTWSEEFFVAISRATAYASAQNVAFMTPRGRGLRPAIGKTARAGLTVDWIDLGGAQAERYCPKGPPSGTILWFHGGGFVAGSVGLERRVAADRALSSNCDTYSIDYRLAPEHPFPGALDDAVAAYRALLDRGTDPATTVLLGGSAGAGLALSAMLKFRELGLPQPAGTILLWPYADFTFSGESIATNADIDMLPMRDLSRVWGPAYVGAADPADPLLSPALADLTGLPPLLIIAGGAESLLSCAEQIHANGRRDGVEARLSVYPEKVHGWMILPRLPATIQATEEIDRWISQRLDVSR